ncbi:MAG: signal peptidase II [Gemmatimonadales bacterium]|nr:signal peptidase II [Gemmatimonadales bacterium]
MPRSADRRVPFWGVLFVTVLLDRITKVIAERNLVWGDTPIPVIGEFARWRLVYNPGAAFGIHLGSFSRWAFMAIACIAVVLLYRMWREAELADRFRQLALSFVAGGAAGNLIDRIISPRGVVDFIDIGLGATRWPTFNIADIAVSCGAIALALSFWREDAQRAPAPTA